MSLQARRAAGMRGRRAEWLAALWLRLKGYRVLDRDVRFPVGEIDLVARRGRVLAIVEVKRRTAPEVAAEAVAARQRRRIVRAAQLYLQRNPQLLRCDLRFDALLLVPGRWPRHIIDAWREPG